MSVNSFNDSFSVIDLSRDGRNTSMSSGSQSYPASQYRICLQSINDDDLKLFHRDLVTPAPSMYDDDGLFSRSFVRRFPRPASRTESVMLFKKINNGDKDVSVDPVSNEVLETNSIMDSLLSRSESRITRSRADSHTLLKKLKNDDRDVPARPVFDEKPNLKVDSMASRLRRISRSNNTSRTESLSLFKKIKNGDKDVSVDHVSDEMLDTNSIMNGMSSRPVSRTTILNNASKIQEISNYRDTCGKMDELLQQKKKGSLTTSPSSNPLTKSEYNRLAPNKAIQQQRSPNKVIEPKYLTRDEHLYKQTPKRLVPTREKPATTYYTKRDTVSVPMIMPMSVTAPVPAPASVLEQRHPKPSYVRSFVSEPSRDIPSSMVDYNHTIEEQLAPRMTRKQGGGFSNYINTPRSSRNRSDTTSSSSSEEPYEEEPLFINRTSQLLHHYNTITKPVESQNHASIPSGHYSSPVIKHRYSVPNNRHIQGEHQETEYRSLSSRISRRPDKTMSVTDSAKQLLASIRERRKSALIIEQSPKAEGRTRFISSSLTLQQQDSSEFRSRFHIHRESTSNRSSAGKYASTCGSGGARRYEEKQGNDGRLTSRLPQRTLYR